MRWAGNALGRPRCKWVEYIRMDLVEVDWILAQDRDRWRTTGDLSCSAQLHSVS
jgi:hypothetical protein